MMWIFSVQNKSVNDLHVKYISNLFSTRHHITKTVAINFFIVLRIKRGSVVHSFICCSPHRRFSFKIYLNINLLYLFILSIFLLLNYNTVI